jgi:hypothetical protein
MAMLASSAIPYRGCVRRLSGAERHDRLVQAAIEAGAVRRGYLKGLGEARGCDPPATPSHVLTEIALEAKAQQAKAEKEKAEKEKEPVRSHSDPRFTPRYPTR